MKRVGGLLAAAVAVIGLAWPAAAGAGTSIPLVSDHASDLMPAIPGTDCLKGQTGCRRVDVIAQIGGWMYVGGIIDKVIDRSTGTTISGFHNLFRFNPATGAVDTSFKPQFYKSSQTDYTDSAVSGLAGNSTTVYVAGAFTQFASGPGAAGTSRKGVAAITTGGSLTSFDAHVCQGGGSCVVYNLNLVGGSLWLAGTFSHVAGTARNVLAFVSPTSGAPAGQPARHLRAAEHGRDDPSPAGRDQPAADPGGDHRQLHHRRRCHPPRGCRAGSHQWWRRDGRLVERSH
jgi:hypothetical protein